MPRDHRAHHSRLAVDVGVRFVIFGPEPGLVWAGRNPVKPVFPHVGEHHRDHACLARPVFLAAAHQAQHGHGLQRLGLAASEIVDEEAQPGRGIHEELAGVHLVAVGLADLLGHLMDPELGALAQVERVRHDGLVTLEPVRRAVDLALFHPAGRDGTLGASGESCSGECEASAQKRTPVERRVVPRLCHSAPPREWKYYASIMMLVYNTRPCPAAARCVRR